MYITLLSWKTTQSTISSKSGTLTSDLVSLYFFLHNSKTYLLNLLPRKEALLYGDIKSF